jgi:hypothetical protein
VVLNSGHHQHRNREPLDWVYLIKRFRDLYTQTNNPEPVRLLITVIQALQSTDPHIGQRSSPRDRAPVKVRNYRFATLTSCRRPRQRAKSDLPFEGYRIVSAIAAKRSLQDRGQRKVRAHLCSKVIPRMRLNHRLCLRRISFIAVWSWAFGSAKGFSACWGIWGTAGASATFATA